MNRRQALAGMMLAATALPFGTMPPAGAADQATQDFLRAMSRTYGENPVIVYFHKKGDDCGYCGLAGPQLELAVNGDKLASQNWRIEKIDAEEHPGLFAELAPSLHVPAFVAVIYGQVAGRMESLQLQADFERKLPGFLSSAQRNRPYIAPQSGPA